MSDCIEPSCFIKKERTARKSHRCCECGSEICKGDVYEYCSGVWDSSPESYKTCNSCSALRIGYREVSGEDLAFGYLMEEISGCFYKGYGAVEFAKDHRELLENICKLFRINIHENPELLK